MRQSGLLLPRFCEIRSGSELLRHAFAVLGGAGAAVLFAVTGDGHLRNLQLLSQLGHLVGKRGVGALGGFLPWSVLQDCGSYRYAH